MAKNFSMSESNTMLIGVSNRCDISHRQGVTKYIYHENALSCDNCPMTNDFPLELVRQSVRRLMEECDDAPKPLAAKMGLGETAIRDIFMPKAKSVSGKKLAKIAQHYGVSLDAILDGTATTQKSAAQNQNGIVSAETLQPILAQCLRLSPKSVGWTDEDVQLLAESVEYGLRFLAASNSTQPTKDDLVVAGRTAAFHLQQRIDQA